MDVSCAFAPVPDTPDHIALAERLGYRRAWVYDTPALQLDVWMTLARAADRTRRIDIGPGVLIPSLRHVLVTAAAIATLVDIAPGRVVVGIGSGFTGRLAMGQRPNPWSMVTRYAEDLRKLLAGDTVEVDGGLTAMLHGADQAPRRPIRVPVVFAVGGARSQAAARDAGVDGVFTVVPTRGFPWSILLVLGTVLEPAESLDAPRVLDAAGPGAAVVLHRAHDRASVNAAGLVDLPGGPTWQAAIEVFPGAERHLHTHEGHHTYLNAIDRRVVDGDLVRRFTFTGEPAVLRGRLADLAARGVTEVAYHPAGPDVPRELTAFARMARLGEGDRRAAE